MIDIKVPSVGESISEVTLLKWTKKEGDYVERDEVIAELESEKATFEVNAEKAGTLKRLANEGDTILIGSVLAQIDETAVKPVDSVPITDDSKKKEETQKIVSSPSSRDGDIKATPVANAIIADKKVDPSSITASGYGGKILKHDVLDALSHPGKKAFDCAELFSRNVRTEKMSNLRKTISKRLVEAKNTTAMLTTFNEVDMGAIMDIRKKHKDKFKEAHGEWPTVNAYIDGDQIMYHDYADISIAVSTPRGLTVPVIRNVESLSMADVEKKVVELAAKARDSKLTADELTGGTFTITNGGVFGSLMSTPIINIPQSAILGMHKIQDRPMAINGKVEIRPMMYLALSYDHRIVDGRESVSFLVRVKELLENPELILLGKDPVKTLLEL